MANQEKNNTTQKGDAFEKRVFNIINSLIAKHTFPTNCTYTKVFAKKKYQAIEGMDIIFDIAVETSMPDSDTPSTIFLIECKDYTSSISVDRIRNFHSQIQSVGAHKGFFFTSAPLQSGALQMAQKHNIGVVLVQPDDSLEWKVRRTYTNSSDILRHEAEKYICGQETSCVFPFVAKCDDIIYTNIYDFISQELDQQLTEDINLSYLTNDDINECIYKETGRDSQWHGVTTTLQMEDMLAQRGYEIVSSRLPKGILGEIDIENKKVGISTDLRYDSPRWRFTIAHEIGHILLHESILKNIKYCELKNAIDEECNTLAISDKNLRRMEIQANTFAVQLLLPDHALQYEYALWYAKHKFARFPIIRIDSQSCNRELPRQVFSYLASTFNVSIEMIINYFRAKNWLEEKTPITLSELLYNYPNI